MEKQLFPNETQDARLQLLRDNAHAIVQRPVTLAFDDEKVAEMRVELESVSIQIKELEDELAALRADFKGRIKPLQERRSNILDELKIKGTYQIVDCFVFNDPDSGMKGIYNPHGKLIEQRPLNEQD